MISQRFAFTAGEWSPRKRARSDLEQYTRALLRCENFLPSAHGRSRPGTEFLGAAKYPDRKARLERFTFSTSTNFVLELGHLYCRFWSNGLPVTVAGLPVEVATPYTEDQLFDVDLRQEKDVVYFAHSAHLPQRLTRKSDTVWEWVETPFTAWPYRDANPTRGHTLTANATSGAGVVITSSASLFSESQIGSRIQISHRRTSGTVQIPLTANASSDSLSAKGEVTIRTSGTWDAVLTLEQSYDGGASWETAYTLKAKSDMNFETVVSLDARSTVRLTVSGYLGHAGSTAPQAYLIASDPWHHGVALITSILSDTQAVAVLESPLFSTEATDYWALSAWSAAHGYPALLELHENRIWYASTTKDPLTIWGSVLGDFECFETGTFADDALAVNVASPQDNRIVWLRSYQRSLFFGTTAAEWTLQARTEGETMSATNFVFSLRATNGSKHFPAIQFGDSLLFVQRLGNTIRNLTYNFERDAFSGLDVSQGAEHLLQPGLIQAAFTQEPDATSWWVNGAGMLLGFSYERDEGVMAWHRHTTPGLFESVTSFPATNADEVWFVVHRQIGGQSVRYIERFEPQTDNHAWAGEAEHCLYSDCGRKFTFAEASATLTGLEHLEGHEIAIQGDGATLGRQTVTGGQVTLSHPVILANVGLPMMPKLEIMPLVAPEDLGTTLGKASRIHRIKPTVQLTRGLQYTVFGPDAPDEDWFDVFTRAVGYAMDAPPPLFSGEYDLTAPPYIAPTLTVAFRQAQPQPFSLLSLVIEWSPLEKSA